MKKIAAVIQIILVLFLVGFGTYHLYLGNFEVSMLTVPFLVGYYLLLVALKKKAE
jgi:hypothetical protein